MAEPAVAIVGCGRMGRIRAEGAARCGARVVEVCDADLERARELAGGFPGCRARGDHAELNWERVDAVFVCTPPFARGPVELEAIDRGVPFMVEKPVGLGVTNLAAVAAALDARSVASAVGYMNRYRPSVRRARELLQGQPILGAACHWIGTRYKVPWWSRQEQSGGPVNEQATHLVDLARHLVGEIDAVQGIASAGAETATFNLRFRDAGVFSIFYSCEGESKMIDMRVFTAAMEVVLDGWDFRLVSPESVAPRGEERDAIFHEETAAFLAAASGENPRAVLCDFRDGLRTQTVVDALVRSLTSGKVEAVAP